ncbi:MAG: glycoside hydrolase family 43 protein [Bacteroidales bacterium]|nr:glycoside hydrolase family 43 protein [Bacteroidales bacterium]
MYYNENVRDIFVRDPFIVVDREAERYYLYKGNQPHVDVMKSMDLKMWKDEGHAFSATADFWGRYDFWAPDVYFYEGKYYMFTTFNSDDANRGTSVLESPTPGGPFTPLVNQSLTPTEWECLDASLYVDGEGDPWILYCREWLEVIDGEIYVQQVTSDLKATAGDPQLLFTASSAEWTGPISHGDITGYVTDAPFIYEASNGELWMLWSSFTKTGKYAIGLARSESGSVKGPWIHFDEPLNNDNGGHAMLFTDLDGRLMISYHAPNSGDTRAIIKEVYETEDRIVIPE